MARYRYADDFVVIVRGTRQDTLRLTEEIAQVLAPMGLLLSAAKTQVVDLSDGFGFLGFRIQRKRKRGTNKSYVYTFIDQRPIRSVKVKIRALTHRTSQQDLGTVLTRLNQVMHGWANYFKRAVAKNVFGMLDNFAWWRGDPHADGPASLEMDRRPPTVHRTYGTVAGDRGGRDRTAADRGDTGHPVPLPRQHDHHPLGPTDRLTAETVESPLR